MSGASDPIGGFRELKVRRGPASIEVQLHRPQRQNSLDDGVLTELHRALDLAEQQEDGRLFLLSGLPDIFCTGMDLEAASSSFSEAEASEGDTSVYMRLLKRLSSCPRVVIAKVEGKVMAGGVGLVAASDLVFAGPQASFSLSEALWGLLPAMVMPFLIRRIGFQRAYEMTISTRKVEAEEAARIGLVDHQVADLEVALRPHLARLRRLHPETLRDLKSYFRRMWIVNEEMEREATAELARLMKEPRIQGNIRNYVELGRLPWERW